MDMVGIRFHSLYTFQDKKNKFMHSDDSVLDKGKSHAESLNEN